MISNLARVLEGVGGWGSGMLKEWSGVAGTLVLLKENGKVNLVIV